jgi:regulation of enolase protein 1 (concanavalin A-like superfamily)
LVRLDVSSDQPIQLPGVPLDLRWAPPPENWEISGGTLTVRAGALTDHFHDPAGGPPVRTAPRLLGPAAGDFQLSARVTVDFVARFDAGALFVHLAEETWAKLCFEYSPLQEPTVVSVVTRGLSDDCNSYPAAENATWLRVARLGGAFAFHCSTDGAAWKLVRHFALGPAATVELGVLAQSPEGAGCTVRFESIRYQPERLLNIRSGV